TYLSSGSLTVEGHQLSSEDLRVQRKLKESKETANLEVAVEGEVLVLLDSYAYPELAQEGLAREVLNRVQRLRKKAGLVPTDDVKLAYSVLPPAAAANGAATEGEKDANSEVSRLEAERQIEDMFANQAAAFTKAASKGVRKEASPESSGVIAEEEAEVKDLRLMLRLMRV
ncbi:hypothetical protein KC336_g21492, partial [Hortaea werneckii]